MLKDMKIFRTRVIVWLLLLVFVMLVTMCCTKKNPFVPPEPEKEDYWNHFLIYDNTYLNFITNGFADENTFYCSTDFGVMMFDEIGTVAYIKRLSSSTSHGFDSRPLFSKDFVAFTMQFDQRSVGFAHYDRHDGESTSVEPRYFGEEFRDHYFHLRTFRNNDFGAFNNKNHFATVMTDVRHGGRDNYIIYVDIDRDFWGPALLPKGFWKIPSMQNSRLTIYDIFSFGEKFYLSFYRQEPYDGNSVACHYVEISPDGTIRDFRNPFGISGIMIVSFFEHQGMLFAQTGDYALRYTADGENWNFCLYLRPFTHTLKEIDEYVFLFSADNIGVLIDLLDEPKVYLLPKENMAGSVITSVNKFKDDLVVTTTHGIFYKSFEEVMNDKTAIFTPVNGQCSFYLVFL